MNMTRLLSAVLVMASGFLAPALAQDAIFEEVRTLSRGPQALERTVDFPAPGSYRLTLTDLSIPGPFASLQAAVTRGDTVVATATMPGTVDVGVTTAGAHVVRVIGIPAASAGAGSVGVRITNPAAGNTVLEFADAIDAPAPLTPPNRRTLDTTFDVATAGSHQVTLADHAFPQALSTLTLAILRDGGATLDAQLAGPGNTTFMATPGRYRLLVIGEAGVSGAGAFGVHVHQVATQAVVYSRSEGVGSLHEVELPAALVAGTHELRVSDLVFPVPLASAGALVTAGGSLAARRDAPGATPFTAAAGPHQLFLRASASASQPGTLGVELRRAGSLVFETVSNVQATDSTATTRTFSYVIDVPTAGSYRLRFTDFEFPQPLLSKGFAATQNGVLLGSLNTGGSLELVNVAAGRLFVVAFAQPAVGNTSGLSGIDLTSSGATSPLFERTEAIGSLFFARKVNIPAAGAYQVAVSDLAFPAAFGELAAVITRGAQRQGSVFAGGNFGFDATAGEYTISVIAQPSASSVYGTYALRVGPRPPAPAITFSADNASVTNGGTAMLTWSSTNASSCQASGGWSGNKALSGSERSPAITQSTTFTISCEGLGGQRSASVTVTPRAATGSGDGSSGGGGRFDGWLLAALMAGLWFMRSRHARSEGRMGLGISAALLAICLPHSHPALADEGVASAVSRTIAKSTPATEDRSYRIQPGDVLVVAVWKERDLQGDILVRPDGGITFPLAGDLAAGGRTVVELANDLSKNLERYIPDPVVTVAVKSIGGNRVYVLGKVHRPGEFAFSQPVDVMQALALAGGATSFAAVNDIRILRRTGDKLVAVEFHYADVERGRKLEQNIVLRSGDTVVVP